MISSNGVGGTVSTTYKYEGAKAHLQGRGFLGFSAATSTGPTGVASRVESNTAFPLTGTTKRTAVSSSNVALSDTSTAYESTVTQGSGQLAAYFVYPTSSVSKTWDLSTAFINWVETSTPAANYDLVYGNLKKVDTTYKDVNGVPDGYSQTVQTIYQDDATNWILGLPTSVTATNRIPGKPDSVRTTTNSYYVANPGLGLLQQNTIEPNDAASLKLVTAYTYNGLGKVLTREVSGPNIVARTEATLTYDPEGRFVQTQANALNGINGLNQTEVRTWDPKFGGMLTLTGPNQLTTSWSYDLFGRQLTEDRADGTRTTLSYNLCAGCIPGAAYSVGRTETVISSGATADPPSRTYYDTLGRSILTSQTGFNGQDVYRETVYDSIGRVGYSSLNYFASDPTIRWTQFDYDVLGRTSKTTAPDNTLTTATYNGRKTSVTNHSGVTNSRTVNSQGKVVSIIDAEGTSDESSVAYEYDHWGSLTKTTDALSNVTAIEYDLRGRKTKLIDPDLGTWLYTVDNLGLVRVQTDNKNQVTTFTYDTLDRMKTRIEPDLRSDWYYDRNAAGVACSMGIGKLCEVTSDNPAYFRRYTYDTKGRLYQQKTHIDVDYDAQWLYSAAGKLETKTYPASTGTAPFASPLVVKYNYDANGILQSVTNEAGGAAYWTRNTENADGNILTETYGNGLIGSRGYDPVMRRLTSLQAGTSGSPTAVQNHGYHYDSLGRLDQRQDSTSGVGTSETFGYDNLNRLTTSIIAGPTGTQTTIVGYNTIGNITSKTGLGTYTYNPNGAASVRPHAVSGVTGTVNGVTNPSFAYDNNGNMLTDGARSFTWTSFNMPGTLTKAAQAGSPGAGTSTFLYGPEHQRLKQTWVDSAKTLSTYYLSEPHFEKEVNTQTGITEYKHYIKVDGRIVAIQTRRSDTTGDIKYLLPDHLGSTTVVTDATGAVLDRQAYDPWGDRRTASGASAGAADPTNLIQPSSTDRGYTGHEHLDQGNMGLVHMNGRVYDPTLGRFISADPTVARPYSSQGFARFAYVRNNPLNSVDPTGYLDVEGMVQAAKDFMSKLFEGFFDSSASTPTVELPKVEVTGNRQKEEKKEDDSKEKSSGASAGALSLSMRAAAASGPRVNSSVVAAVMRTPVGRGVVVGTATTFIARNPIAGVALGVMAATLTGDTSNSEGQAEDSLNAGAGAAAPPPEGGDEGGGDNQKKGKPERNTDQNKRVKDAAREAGLNNEQRRLLGRIVERDSRQGGENLTYQNIRAIADEIKAGRTHY